MPTSSTPLLGNQSDVLHDSEIDSHYHDDRKCSHVSCPDSPEFLEPAHHSDLRHASSINFVSSLVSTMLGGGILSLPYAIAHCGVIFGIILLFIVACVNDFSIYALVAASRRSGGTTYELVAQRAFGKWAQFGVVCLLLILTCLCCVGYLVLMADLIYPLFHFMLKSVWKDSWMESMGYQWGRRLVISFAVVLTYPLCCLESLDKLSFTSLVGTFSILCLAVALAVRGISCYVDENAGEWCAIPTGGKGITGIKMWPTDFNHVLIALPIITVAYLCHFNVLGMHSAYRNPSRKRINRVMHMTIGTAACLYSFVGISGYLYAQNDVCGNVLNNFKTSDVLMVAGRFGLAVTVLLSYPLLVVPCRNTFNKFFSFIKNELLNPKTKPIENEQQSVIIYESIDESTSCSSSDGDEDHQDNTDVRKKRKKKRQQERELDPDNPKFAYDDDNDDSLASPRIWHGRKSLLPVGHGLRESDSLRPNPLSAATVHLPLFFRCIQTFFITCGAMVFAWYVPGVVTVWSIMGSSVCLVIAYILPSLFYLKVRASKSYNWRKFCCQLLILVSIILIPMCTYESVIQTKYGNVALSGMACE